MKFNLFTLISLLAAGWLGAQVPKDFVLPLTATVTTSPAKVALNWAGPATGDTAFVARREKDSPDWFIIASGLGSGPVSINDNTVVAGKAYEYLAVQQFNTLPTKAGFMAVAVETPLVESRGKILLFEDVNIQSPLAAELARLEEDLIGDGWEPVKFTVTPNSTVSSIKTAIQAAYAADPTGVKSVLLLGEVPVPYSGDGIDPTLTNLGWDAHPDHGGAWPADAYYGDVDGTYTDATANNLTPARPANQNTPGDGKFDQSILPSPVELTVGRVDFRHLTQGTFGSTPVELMRRYLNKDHDWRVKKYTVAEKAIIDDNFGVLLYPDGYEAFAESGWRAAIPLVGEANVVEADFFNNTNPDSYLYAYGCGGGNYMGASGVGSSANFASDTVNAVFTNLFGSYFGDWDSETDPFMPAALASRGGILNTMWTGRPGNYWHTLTFGEPVGYALKETQNTLWNAGYLLYFGDGGMHVSLLGDPSIRTHYIAPASNLGAVQNCQDIELNWDISTEAGGVAGYNVYRAEAKAGPYVKLNASLITGKIYTDLGVATGDHFYMVRAVKKTSTPGGGTFWNSSTGVITPITVVPVTPPSLAVTGGVIDCDHATVTLTSTTDDGNALYLWTGPAGFTSLSPTATVDVAGTYNLSIIGSNGCIVEADAVVTENFTKPVALAVAVSKLTCDVLSVSVAGNSNTPNSTYSWTGPGGFTATGKNIQVSESGPYILTVTAPNGCTGTATATVLNDYNPPAIDASTNVATITCLVKTATLLVTSGTPNTTFLWWDGATTPTTVVDHEGLFTVQATGPNGCTAVDTVHVGADLAMPPTVPLPTQILTCAAPCITLPSTVFGIPYQICWSGPGITPNCPPNPTTCQPGVYQATLTNPANGCTSASFLQVDADSGVPNVTATGGTVSCASMLAQLTSNSTTQGATYSWTGPNGWTSSEQNPSAEFEGSYTVVVTTPTGCTAAASVSVLGDFAEPGVTVTVSNVITCAMPTATATATSNTSARPSSGRTVRPAPRRRWAVVTTR